MRCQLGSTKVDVRSVIDCQAKLTIPAIVNGGYFIKFTTLSISVSVYCTMCVRQIRYDTRCYFNVRSKVDIKSA